MIGVIELVFVYVNMYNMSEYLSVELEKCVKVVFKFMLKGIIESLDLLRFIYLFILVYGYFGCELEEFIWEKINKVEEIKVFFKC